MQGMLFYSHSGIRYLLLLAAVVAIVYLVAAIARGKKFDRGSQIVASIYTGVLDLQTLLGLLTLMSIPFYPALLGHVFTMFAAVFAAHGFIMSNKRKPPEEQSNTPVLLGVLISLTLVVLGIMAIGRSVIGSG